MQRQLELLKQSQTPARLRGASVLASIAAAVAALGLQSFTNQFLIGPSFFYFFPAAILVAWFFGFRAGLSTIILCVVGADLLFFEPRFTFGSDSLPEMLTLGFVGASSAFGAWVVAKLDLQRKLAGLAREELSTTLKSIGDAVIVVDREKKVLFLNPIAERLTGWALDDARERPMEEVFKIINEQTRKPAENPVERVLKEGHVVGLANHTVLIARDGAERPIEDSAAPIRTGPSENPTGVVLVFRDVTEKHLVQKRLHESEERLDLALSSAKMGTFFIDLKTNEVLASPELSRILGLGEYRDDIFAAISKMIYPEDRERSERLFREAIEKKKPYENEYRIVLPDGSVKWILSRANVNLNAAGEAVSVSGVTADIDDLKRATEKVRESELKFRQLANSIPQMAWITNSDGIMTYVNDRWTAFTGKTLEETATDGGIGSVHPEDVQTVLDHWTVALRERRPFDMEFRLRNARTGDYEWVLSRGIPVGNKNGRAESWFGTNTNIQPLKLALRELGLAKEEAERANELKSAFLANMSHEIRTPLGAMIGFADLLRDPGLSTAERESYTEILARNGESLSVIINDILDLSKVEAGQLSLEFTDMDPRSVAEDIISLLGVKAREKDLVFEFVCNENTPHTLVSDPVRVRQILLNIVGNAIKFTQFGSVTVHCFPCETDTHRDAVCFEVVDTGIGIPPSQREKVFEMFVQADGSMTRRFGGTGLGLALSKRLALALGGDIEITKTQPGKGSTFLITIENQPHKRNTTVGPERAKKQIVEVRPDALAGLQILVVDDSPDNRQLIWHYLTKQGAFVEVAENGLVGSRKALAGSYDIVLMDIQMPEMDGYTATHKLRSAGYRRPIIALTAHAMSDVRQKCLNVGCTGHLPKPIDPKALVATIAEFTGRTSEVPAQS